MKQIAKKLRSRSGETIAETLVALLVGVLALMVLAGMISATARLVNKSEKKMDDYYKECANLANFGEKVESGTISITVSGNEQQTVISKTADVVKNEIFADHTVTAYRMTTAADGTDTGADDGSGG